MPPLGSPAAVSYLQDELDSKTAAAEAARAEADAAREEAARKRSNANSAAMAYAAAADAADSAKSEASASRDVLVTGLNGTDLAKATFLADAAIVDANVLDILSTIDAESEDDACEAAYAALDVSPDEGVCEASIPVSARRKRLRTRRLLKIGSYHVSVLLSSAQTNQTLIDAAVVTLGLNAPNASNVQNAVVDPIDAMRDIPGVNSEKATAFETAATAATAAASNATTLKAEAVLAEEAATSNEARVMILDANVVTLDLEVETTRTRLDDATAAANAPQPGKTDSTGIIAGAVGSFAFLCITFAVYRYRNRLFRNRHVSNNHPPRLAGRGASRRDVSGFGGFGASGAAARDDTAPAPPPASNTDPQPFGDSQPSAAGRYAVSPQGTAGTSLPSDQRAPDIPSPTERGWADFPSDSPQTDRNARANTPARVSQRWTRAPMPAPMQSPDSFPMPDSQFPTPSVYEYTRDTQGGYHSPAAFAGFGGEGTPVPNIFAETVPSVPGSVRAETATPFTNVDSEPTPVSLASPSEAFAGFVDQSSTRESIHDNQHTVVPTNSFQTPAPGVPAAFASDAESDDPFGDASDAESDPFGDVDDSDEDT